jgi:hypothetical protein
VQTGTRVGSAITNGLGWVAQAALILAIVAAVVLAGATATGNNPAGANSVLAAKVSTSSITLARTTALAAAQEPALGSTVSFDTTYPSNTKNPRIQVMCYQDGSLVYGEAGGVTDSFKLGGGGSIWLTSGGAAECTANLFYFGWRAGVQTFNVLASTSFSATG